MRSSCGAIYEIGGASALGTCGTKDVALGRQNPHLVTALFRSVLETPFGQMHVAVNDGGVLIELWLPNRAPGAESRAPFTSAARGGMRAVEAQLNEYFAGKRRIFDLQFEPHGTAFERSVWARLCAIPYGATTSYGAIAAEFGTTNGARAVGRANGANPIPIVIPCHRVIGADGRLTGFGGGLPLKQALLELEGAILPHPRALGNGEQLGLFR